MKLACMCLELGAWVQARVLPIKGLVAAAAGRPIWGRHREATTACFCCPFQLGAGFHLVSLFQGNIVALVHDSGDTQDEENDILLNGLSHQSHLILRAEGLATGFCRDVHGQVRRGRDPPGNRLPASECRQHEGRRRKLCESQAESAPAGAWRHVPVWVSRAGPIRDQSGAPEEEAVVWGTRQGPAVELQNPSAGLRQASYSGPHCSF